MNNRCSDCDNVTRLKLWFSRIDSSLCIYHLVEWSKFNLLHNFQWISFPNNLYVVMYYSCVCFLHSLTMWLTVSIFFCIRYNRYSVECYCFLFEHNWFIWFCAAVKRFISLLRFWDFPFVAMKMFFRVQSHQFVAWNNHTVIVFLSYFYFLIVILFLSGLMLPILWFSSFNES